MYAERVYDSPHPSRTPGSAVIPGHGYAIATENPNTTTVRDDVSRPPNGGRISCLGAPKDRILRTSRQKLRCAPTAAPLDEHISAAQVYRAA